VVILLTLNFIMLILGIAISRKRWAISWLYFVLVNVWQPVRGLLWVAEEYRWFPFFLRGPIVSNSLNLGKWLVPLVETLLGIFQVHLVEASVVDILKTEIDFMFIFPFVDLFLGIIMGWHQQWRNLWPSLRRGNIWIKGLLCVWRVLKYSNRLLGSTCLWSWFRNSQMLHMICSNL